MKEENEKLTKKNAEVTAQLASLRTAFEKMLTEKEKDRTMVTQLQAKNKQLELQVEKNKLKMDSMKGKQEPEQDIEKVL